MTSINAGEDAGAATGFHRGLREAVFGFLKSNSLNPIDESGLMRKAIINYTMWFTLYAAYLFVGAQYGWYALLLVLPLAFAMLCIVLSVMHDGSHGAFSNSRFINSLASCTRCENSLGPISSHQLRKCGCQCSRARCSVRSLERFTLFGIRSVRLTLDMPVPLLLGALAPW